MTDRQREREAGGGGLTGATGDLVPPDPSDELLTGERREVEGGASQRADVTTSMRGHSGPTKGLPDDDPAYPMERNPSASESTDEPGERRTPPAMGGDETGEPDRF